MTLTTDAVHAELDGAFACECVHPMPWGAEPCAEPATFEAVHAHHTVLLCGECLEGRRDQDLESFGAVTFTFREL